MGFVLKKRNKEKSFDTKGAQLGENGNTKSVVEICKADECLDGFQPFLKDTNCILSFVSLKWCVLHLQRRWCKVML